MKQKFQTLKKAIDGKLHWIVGAVIVIQPALDVLSYFLGELGNNSFSTALRFLLLMAVALLGFVVSDKKRVYVIFYGIMGAFWVAHMANCYRIGYQSMVADTANFLRIMSFPMYTFPLSPFFKRGRTSASGFTPALPSIWRRLCCSPRCPGPRGTRCTPMPAWAWG